MEKGKIAVIAKRKRLCIIFKNRLKLFFIILISCALHAQPGVSIEQKKQYFNECTLEIKKRPDDVDLRIKRIRITQLDKHNKSFD